MSQKDRTVTSSNDIELQCPNCAHASVDHYASGCGWCICKVAGPAPDDFDESREAFHGDAVVPQELVSRVLALCSYVGDHGGGERERCNPGAERCPSCAANAIATELAAVAGMTYGN